jgi:hypothetical protein
VRICPEKPWILGAIGVVAVHSRVSTVRSRDRASLAARDDHGLSRLRHHAKIAGGLHWSDSNKRPGEEAVSEVRKFDPDQSWAPLDARISKETDPRRREVLQQVRDHMCTEISGDFDGLMATLTDEPRYHFWGLPIEGGPKGRKAVAEFYSQMIATRGHRFHFDIERIVVDEDTVVTEGKIHQTIAFEALRASGIDEVGGEPLDDDATYIAETHIVTVWPIAPDGRIIGEDIYFGSPPLENLRRL